MQLKEKYSWAVVILGSILAVFVPFLFYKLTFGSWIPAIIPQLETDTIYYLTHIQQVLSGHATLGNPYFLEYRDSAFPGLLLPIYLASIPGLLGFDIHVVYAINAVLYAAITGGIIFVLNRKILQGRLVVSALITIVGIASLANLISRPGIMQTIYPVFGLFMIALLMVLRSPHEAKRYVPLGIISAIAFYLYPHLWMQNFTSIGLFFLYALFSRDTKTIKLLMMMGVGIIVACIPQILTTISLFTDPVASAINTRSGLIDTHIVLPLTIYNNKYSIVLIGTLVLLRFRRHFSSEEALLLLLTSAVVIAATSNVITGKVMDFVTHPWRLALLVNIVAIPILIQSLSKRKTQCEKMVIILCVAAMIFTTVNRAFIRKNSYSYTLSPYKERVVEAHENISGFADVFAALEQEGVHDAVLHGGPMLSFYIPLYSPNGILFTPRAALHVAPDEELLERFLVAYSGHIDEAFLRESVSNYAGLNPTYSLRYLSAYPDTTPLGVAKTFLFGLDGSVNEKITVDPMDLIGGDAYIQNALKLSAEIDSNYEEYLKKYNVRYLVADTKDERAIQIPKSASILYKNGRFIVYEVN
ncbi:MAG: hypothetical protein HOG89_03510 [Candidatus Peribacter sp.]|jgi:hypothetical protein|nr:hypothetical protein [Candidatus Peribacter sp.]MBT4393139.1 hypothetical protein [Candidatus Peribacter sp.]MBT4600517.1 hypothetical protein [Candidatus Peribacter sp.]MBT5148507.1 hypothetical protein [Candidatus Peribacter sp.]MBT5638674.1 hypothetical protein [Candidatus Peribacter sp.]